MTMGAFEAFALPALNAPGADHTYVVLDGSIACGCHGRFAGGTVVSAGRGHVEFGECLATPTGNAGVSYGISGVCHQASNRILWPAGITVLAARGARTSMRAWGTYGRSGLQLYSPPSFPWRELTMCSSIHGAP
jgi:hypothetical protein